MNNSSPYILLADDHVIIRRGLKVLLDTNFVESRIEECDSVKDLMQLIETHPFTHLILDLQLIDGNVMDVIQDIKKKFKKLPILIYSMSSEEIFGTRTLQFGADSFLSKQSNEEEVIKALNLFLNGKQYISQELQDFLANQLNKKTKTQNPFMDLSDREILVLNYLLSGETVKDISTRLDLKATTVATYKARIFDKLNVTNILELGNMAKLYRYNKS